MLHQPALKVESATDTATDFSIRSSATPVSNADISSSEQPDESTQTNTDSLSKKSKSSRRSVACKSCHALKVKCTPADPTNPGGTCIRCLNGRRKCEIDLNQTRKRRKKADIIGARQSAAAITAVSAANGARGGTTMTDSANTSGISLGPQGVMSRGILSAPESVAISSVPSPRFDIKPTNTGITSLQANGMTQKVSPSPPLSTMHSPSLHTPIMRSNPPPPPKDITNLPSVSSPLNDTSEPADIEVVRLRQRVKQLEAQLAQRHNHNHVHHRRSSLNSNSDTISDVNSPPFISKFDLEREITILVESSTTKLTDLTQELNAVAGQRTSLLRNGMTIDMVSSGLISIKEAEERLSVYRNKIYALNPLVEIPVSVSVNEFRKKSPFLFNAVMSVSNALYCQGGNGSTEHALRIDNEAIRTVTFEIMVTGTKSDELIKSCLILCLWYNSPELFRQRRYHLLNTICVSLLHDLGIISRRTYSFRAPPAGTAAEESNGYDPSKGNVEYRSLILIIYFTTVSICLILRRTINVKWTPYVEECCGILESSPDPRYHNLALFSRLNHCLDKIHHILHAPEISETRTSTSSYIIQDLQKQLTVIRLKFSDDDHANLAYYFSVEAYLHEPCLTNIFALNEGENDQQKGGVKLNENAIKSISNCTSSCLNALDEFNHLTSEQVAAIPLFYGCRIIYTAGMLLRLRYLILSLPSLIEKDLVPRHAVTAIQRTSKLVEQANLMHPTNHFLKKTRLVLQLFIQTYATEVQDLLRKSGETPQNFKPNEQELNEMEKLVSQYQSHVRTNRKSLLNDEPERVGSSVPLDILSYAASVRRDSSSGGKDKRSNSEAGASQRENIAPMFNSADNTPIVSESPAPPQLQPIYTQQQQESDIRTNDGTKYSPTTKISPAHYSFRGINSSITGLNSGLNPLFNSQQQQLSQTMIPEQIQQSDISRLPSISAATTLDPTMSGSTNMAGKPHSLSFSHNLLAHPDHLESSYMTLNDEFWADLLSTDADRLNFSNNNANTAQLNDEVFFMKN
ncbi:Transcriptional regulator WAR1 [Spathaspora sp. JA1]|nr:Transcriptional regulator WAR1 [Spathaspora sp. JA1]